MNIQIQKEEIEGAASEEAIRLALGRAARRRARIERDRARVLNDGQTAAAPSKTQMKTLNAADEIEAAARALLARDRKTTTVADRKAARGKIGEAFTLRAAVEAERQAALTRRQDDLRLGEAAALDALREDGEPDSQIERRRGQKDVRMKSRDGLVMLHASGAFTPRDADGGVRRDQAARIEADRLLAIGLRYRDRFEMAASSLKSCLGSSDQVATQRNVYVEARAAQRRAAVNGKVREWEAMVSMGLGSDALLALRMIAGEARSVNSITSAARRRDRLAKALKAALGMISDRVEKDR